MFGSKTPMTVVPPGYKPDFDRLPPQPNRGLSTGCGWMFILFISLGVIVLAVMWFISSNTPQPESEPQSQPPIQNVDILATLKAVPTLDDWSKLGTQYYHETVEALATDDANANAEETAEITDEPASDSITVTATWTPIPLPTNIPHINVEDLTPSATITNTVIPTSTLFPTAVPRVNRPRTVIQEVVVKETVVVEKVIEVEKPVEKIKEVKVEVIVTATPQPTDTTAPEVTQEVTLPPDTIEPTLIPSVTPSKTLTPTLTVTNTSTATATSTSTPTATFTLIPTSTLFPTLEPTNTPPETTQEVDNA